MKHPAELRQTDDCTAPLSLSLSLPSASHRHHLPFTRHRSFVPLPHYTIFPARSGSRAHRRLPIPAAVPLPGPPSPANEIDCTTTNDSPLSPPTFAFMVNCQRGPPGTTGSGSSAFASPSTGKF